MRADLDGRQGDAVVQHGGQAVHEGHAQHGSVEEIRAQVQHRAHRQPARRAPLQPGRYSLAVMKEGACMPTKTHAPTWQSVPPHH